MKTKMKKILRCLLCLLLCLAAFAPAAYAEDIPPDGLYSQIPQILAENAEAADFAGLLSYSAPAARALRPQNLLLLALSELKDAFAGNFGGILTLITVTFLAAIIGTFSANLSSGGKLCEYVTLLGAMLLVFSRIEPLIASVGAFLSRYLAFMTSVNGAMGVLLAAGGNVSAAAVSSSSAAFTVGITQILADGAVLPAARIVIALSAIGALSCSLDLSGVISFLKSFCSWGLGVLFAVFGGVHAAAVHTAAGGDSLAIRGIRFSAARLVPVAGNMLSESLRTVLSGISVIRGAFGALGILYVLYSLLPPLMAILSIKCGVLVASFCSKLLGTRPLTSFFDGVNAALNILMAICLFASVSGIIIFAVFCGTMTTLA